NLFLIVQLHFSKLFLILKSGVNHTSRGSISTSTLPSIKLRKCSSKIITSILSFISGRLATKSNQIKQLIRNGRSASLQRTFKKNLSSSKGPKPLQLKLLTTYIPKTSAFTLAFSTSQRLRTTRASARTFFTFRHYITPSARNF